MGSLVLSSGMLLPEIAPSGEPFVVNLILRRAPGANLEERGRIRVEYRPERFRTRTALPPQVLFPGTNLLRNECPVQISCETSLFSVQIYRGVDPAHGVHLAWSESHETRFR
eukprot:353711-Rhodomonas_salina.2